MNVASIKSPCSSSRNGHLGILLTATQYALVSQVPLVRLTDTGCTTTIPEWATPFNEKALLREHAKQRKQYNECCNVNAALCNQLLTVFGDTYLSPLKNTFTGYSVATMLRLLSHLYDHYARILAT